MKRSLVLSCAFLLVPIAALGQSRSWEIEFHGGGVFVNTLSGGTGSLPAPGGPFTPDFRFGYGTLTHPSSRHALIVAGSA